MKMNKRKMTRVYSIESRDMQQNAAKALMKDQISTKTARRAIKILCPKSELRECREGMEISWDWAFYHSQRWKRQSLD
jgi:hypothetical protein